MTLSEWIITDRRFLCSKPECGQEILGVTLSELEKWRSSNYTILEVGSSGGATILDLMNYGITNIYGIEPGLRIERVSKVVKPLIEKRNLNSRIFDLTAEELNDCTTIPKNSIDIAFANGINFQDLFTDIIELRMGLKGIFSRLKPLEETYILLQARLSNNQRPFLYSQNTDLKVFLDYSILNDDAYLNSRLKSSINSVSVDKCSIKLFRINDKGEDILDYL